MQSSKKPWNNILSTATLALPDIEREPSPYPSIGVQVELSVYTIIITFHQIISKPFATYINLYPTPYPSIGVQVELSAYTIVITFHQ